MLAGLRLAAWPAAVMAVMLGAPGCGGGDGGDTRQAERDVRHVYAQLGREFRAHDRAGVCSFMSAAAQRHVGLLAHGKPTTCRRDIGKLFKWIDSESVKRPMGRIADVSVEGAEAAVTVRLNSAANGRLPFVEDDGEWKLDNFFNITAPIPAEIQ